MPKIARELTAMAVSKIRKNGLYSVGGAPGLYLRIAGNSRTWTLRVAIGTRKNHKGQTVAHLRDIGMGSYAEITLAEAREKARELMKKIRNGINPIEERRIEQAKKITFKKCAEAYIQSHRSGWKNARQAQEWENTLSTYAYPYIGALPIADVNLVLILKVLQQQDGTPNGKATLWNSKTKTADRLRSHIENILDFAEVNGLREGRNHAEWKILKHVLPAKNKVHKIKNHPALPYAEIGAFMADLRRREGMSVRALEFTILTAARSGEVRGATWDEIDLDACTWTIPAERMKAGKEHRVSLSDVSVKLLKSLPRLNGNDHVFPATIAVKLSDVELLRVIRRMHEKKLIVDGKGWIDPSQNNRVITPHGFRSTFRDWAGETTSYPREVIEHALAHQLKDKAEAAYQRGDLFVKRKGLMADWARYCETIQTAKGNNVVSIRKRKAV